MQVERGLYGESDEALGGGGAPRTVGDLGAWTGVQVRDEGIHVSCRGEDVNERRAGWQVIPLVGVRRLWRNGSTRRGLPSGMSETLMDDPASLALRRRTGETETCEEDVERDGE